MALLKDDRVAFDKDHGARAVLLDLSYPASPLVECQLILRDLGFRPRRVQVAVLGVVKAGGRVDDAHQLIFFAPML
jgi:hypothetical protein